MSLSTLRRRRIAVLLAWVLALTGGAAVAGTCRHAGSATQVPATGDHAGHAMHGAVDADTPAAADCECGCPCAGACGQACQTPATILAGQQLISLHATALPAVPRAAVLLTSTHPPLRPPAAST